MGRVRALIKSCWVGSRRERARDVTITTIRIPRICNSRNSGIPVSLHILCKWSSWLNPIVSLRDRWGYVLSCRLTSGPLWLRIFLFLWWFVLALFGLFVLHWRYELPCQDKLPEFLNTPIVGCIKVFWLVLHPLGLELDKALLGLNSVTPLCLGIEVICISLPEK